MPRPDAAVPIASHLAAIVESSDDAILSLDPDGRVLTWNHGAERLYGFPAAEMIGAPIERIVPDDRLAELKDALAAARRGEVVPAIETCRLHRDGRPLDVSVNVSAIRDPEGRVVAVSAIDRDIGERVRTRHRLEDSERRFRATFDNAAVGIAHVGLDGRWLHFNERLRVITGYSREALLARTFQDITHPDDVGEDVAQLARLIADEIPHYQMEKRYIRPDGSIAWVQLTASLVRDEAGRALYCVAVVEDIAERKRLAAALHDSQRRMRAAAQVARIGTFEWDVTTNRNLWTPELEALYGLPPGSFGGTYEDWRRYVHPDDLPAAEGFVERALRDGTFKGEWRARWPDGTLRWLEARGWVERDASGAPLRMIGVNFDITERKAAEAAVRESEARYRVALEGGGLGTWILDIDRNQAWWDEQARAIFGLPVDGPIEFALATSVIHPEDRPAALAALAEAVGGGGRYQVEKRIAPPDGDMRWVRTWGLVTRLGSASSDRCLVGMVQDVTAQKRAEQALEEASRRKDDYLAMLGHELRNPLAAIRMATELIKRQSRGVSGLAQASAVLERQSVHMTRLIDGLLDVSRITRGKLTVERRPLDLAALLGEVVADRSADARAAGVRLDIEVPTGAGLWVHADPARMTQVFDNLVSNAIKFTPPGGSVILAAAVEGGEAVVTVRDDGMGFSPALGEVLFEAFQQGPQDIARKAGGLGLGLALARGLVELHDGTIDGHSDGEGQGATFAVRLPILRRGAPIEPDALPPAPAEVSSLRVLVIEDNDDSAAMLRGVLEDAGHRVALAATGAQGIAHALRQPPDAVLCDIGLPDGLSGYDVARRLRDEPTMADVLLVALTGYGRPEDKAASLAAGFDAHLTKPVDPESIAAILAFRRR
ncbi:MAG: PAS domain S-box protein [Myxococcales bacterium]|nr:PAS domain S-box protein [Myxococcales bacterium]